MLIDGLIDFLKDKLRNAVMFAIVSILAFYVWWSMDDEGSLVAGIVFAGIAVQQAYRYHLTRRYKKQDDSH